MFEEIVLFGSIVVAGIYGMVWLYVRTSAGSCKSNRDLSGRTVIVTGANRGIGLETARDLASRNARVILACRDMSRGEAAKRDILNTTGNYDVVVKELDLSSFHSVRCFAEDILKTEKRLDVLVNNGAVVAFSFEQKSVDGVSLAMATNHYGHFLLTNLLLPKLKDCAPSRIVVVSSRSHEMCENVLLDDRIENEKLTPRQLYNMSKLANVLFTRELSQKLNFTGVTVNAVHPGLILTKLGRQVRATRTLKLVVTFFKPLYKTLKEGSQTSIYVAVEEKLEGVSGKYFSDCKEKKLKKHAMDDKAAKVLWEHSEKMTGLTHPNL